MKERTVWIVWYNTDKTEGKGCIIPQYVCQSASTAERLSKRVGVMGSYADVTAARIYKINDMWYGPIHIIYPSIEDIRNEEKIRKKMEIMKKMEDAGITKEEMSILFE